MPVKTIVGPNGSGKSRLVADIVREFCANEGGGAVAEISFRDSYGASDAGYYIQQRWNTTSYDDVPTVRESLALKGLLGKKLPLTEAFDIEGLMDKPMIMLSSGELRKFQIVKALLRSPKLLAIDNPYIGLDVDARARMDALLQAVAGMPSVRLLLVVSREKDVPSYSDEVVRLEASSCGGLKTSSCGGLETSSCGGLETSSCSGSDAFWGNLSVEEACERVCGLGGSNPDYRMAVVLNDVTIRYGQRSILNHLNWKVETGSAWAVEGPNGSGKSTLLSLICADIPQAYACDITLFDHRRGTGESIWDIKRHIGFVSPELHRAYKRNVAAIDVVASGFHDQVGMYRPTSSEQIPQCLFWMEAFGVAGLKDRQFLTLSSGEQRLVLLARAFVKDPDLLILDEPFHGLDDNNASRAKSIIEAFYGRGGKTLIMVSHFKDEFPPCITNHLSLAK